MVTEAEAVRLRSLLLERDESATNLKLQMGDAREQAERYIRSSWAMADLIQDVGERLGMTDEFVDGEAEEVPEDPDDRPSLSDSDDR